MVIQKGTFKMSKWRTSRVLPPYLKQGLVSAAIFQGGNQLIPVMKIVCFIWKYRLCNPLEAKVIIIVTRSGYLKKM